MSVLSIMISFFQAHSYIAYVLLFLGSYLETIIGIGFFIYGEFFFLAGAILAGAGVLNIWIVSAVCISGGILGDSTSYYIGRVYGKRILGKIFREDNRYLSAKNYDSGIRFFSSHGKKSILFARLLGPLSWITPFLAGSLHVKPRDFLKYNIPGVIIGIGQFMVVGYLFGFSYSLMLKKIQKDVFYIMLIVISAIAFYILYKLRVMERLGRKIMRSMGR